MSPTIKAEIWAASQNLVSWLPRQHTQNAVKVGSQSLDCVLLEMNQYCFLTEDLKNIYIVLYFLYNNN